MDRREWTYLNADLMVCHDCGSVVWKWAQNTHDSWHEQIEARWSAGMEGK